MRIKRANDAISGQSVVEVTLAISLVAIVAISLMTATGRRVWCSFANAGKGLAQAMGAYTLDVDGDGIATNFDQLRINLCRPPGT